MADAKPIHSTEPATEAPPAADPKAPKEASAVAPGKPGYTVTLPCGTVRQDN